jgi:hypothetical protein
VTRNRQIALVILILTWAMAPAYAEDGQSDMEAMSRTAANPIANAISLPFQNNTDFGLGTYDRASNVLNIQPVIPFADGKIVTRTIFPIVRVPDLASESGTISTGLSDIVLTAFYVPSSGGVTWGVGPVFQFPSGGDLRGTRKWSAGISGVILVQPGDWTLGALANNVWSFAGEADARDVNQGSLQYFIVYQLGKGWYVNSAPIITVDWEADSGQKWKVPFGAGGGKLLSVGKLPVNLQSQAYFYAVKPDIGPDWQLRLQAQVFLPMPGGGE